MKNKKVAYCVDFATMHNCTKFRSHICNIGDFTEGGILYPPPVLQGSKKPGINRVNEVLLNIYSNFIPNQIKTIQPQKLPWITQAVKRFLRKKNHAYRTFVRNGQPEDKLEGIQKMVAEGARMIEDANKITSKRLGTL